MVMEGVLKHLSDPRCKKPVQGTPTTPSPRRVAQASRPLTDTCRPTDFAACGFACAEAVDFIFCVGDDRTDEDMFQVVKHAQSDAQRQYNAAAPPLPPQTFTAEDDDNPPLPLPSVATALGVLSGSAAQPTGYAEATGVNNPSPPPPPASSRISPAGSPPTPAPDR
jgi:hypothetical protein